MLTDYDLGFLEAICSEPRNDELRLLYADCLEDNGEQLRAKLIRIQCDTPDFIVEDEELVDHWNSNLLCSGSIKDQQLRAQEAVEIIWQIRNSGVFPRSTGEVFWQRGFPLYEVFLGDSMPDVSVEEFFQNRPRWARARVCLSTLKFANWLSHPLMRYADHLVWLTEPDPRKRGRLYNETRTAIEELASSPVIDRLFLVIISGLSRKTTPYAKRLLYWGRKCRVDFLTGYARHGE